MTQYSDCIIFLLAKGHQAVQSNFKRRIKKYGLTTSQHLILEALWVMDGQTAGDLVKQLSLDHATMSGVLDRLAEGGWITKEPDPADKRFLRVHLAKKAKEQVPFLIAEREKANDEILKDLSLEEKELFMRILRNLQAELIDNSEA